SSPSSPAAARRTFSIPKSWAARAPSFCRQGIRERREHSVVTQFEILPARHEQQIPRPANPSGAQKARCARDDSVALESGFKLSHDHRGAASAWGDLHLVQWRVF
ncbi:MAG TPA: hypothetical protein VJ180_04070, partial [Pyrinomonadaceae bacterium]|nr:hypothetical protein [Pyrinomonadaceae bacterium]